MELLARQALLNAASTSTKAMPLEMMLVTTPLHWGGVLCLHLLLSLWVHVPL